MNAVKDKLGEHSARPAPVYVLCSLLACVVGRDEVPHDVIIYVEGRLCVGGGKRKRGARKGGARACI